MKETLRRRITVTLSLNATSCTVLAGKYCRLVVRGGGVTPPALTLFYNRLLD
jgi:hypothetical protein